jgi:hypothetical protein
MKIHISIMTLIVIIMTMTIEVVAQEGYTPPYTLDLRKPAQSTERYGDPSLGAIIRTDERYNKNSLFVGPRGWAYWSYLQNPQPYQDPNLWPDKRPTYFFGNMVLPAGSSLTIHGRFPYARYFKFNFYAFEHNTFVAVAGSSMPGVEIVPDSGSGNPFKVGADRLVKNRNFTIQVLAEDAPKNPSEIPKNTVYVGTKEELLSGGFRIYVSDYGYDGAGWGPAKNSSLVGPGIICEGKLADGTKLSEAEVVQQWGRPLGFAPPPITADAWYNLVNSKDNDPSLDPASAPARLDSKFELFRGMKRELEGPFMTPEQEANIPVAKSMEGGGDPTTAYMVIHLSRKFGPVYVFRGKMPTFPNTYDNAQIMTDGQVQYWSVATMATLTSGNLWDGVFDMQAPLDKDSFYTIVVSLPEDRPKNATLENGVAWINWGPGEGLGDPRNRKDWCALLMRYMVCREDWVNSPQKATIPGMEESVMGPYYPKGFYTSKAEFETNGLKQMTGNVLPVKKVMSGTSITVTGTRDMRFGEIMVVKNDGVEVYNTTGLNNCPAELWDVMDIERIKDQFGALAVQKNGPHFWLMDSQTLDLGETASFGGIEARWAATLDPSIVQKSAKGSEPYKFFTPKKTQKQIYSKGKPVFELVDTDGHIYVMQAHNEQFTIESLANLGEQMKLLPQGWQYRTRTLTEDLVLDLGPDKTIYAIGDEFHQYYTRIEEK